MTTFNQFVTADVLFARDEARIAYLEMLSQARFTGTPVADLAAEQQKRRALLDGGWDLALDAAGLGDIAGATSTFVSIVKAWGRYKALDDLIIALNATGAYLDPASPEISDAFEEAIQTRVVFWSQELHNGWSQGRSASWEIVHRQNRDYADVALRSVQQAQQGIHWMQDGVLTLHQQAGQQMQWMQQEAGKLYGHVQNGMTENQRFLVATARHMEESQPEAIRKAQRQAQWRGCFIRVAMIAALVAIALTSFPIGFIILTQFILRH